MHSFINIVPFLRQFHGCTLTISADSTPNNSISYIKYEKKLNLLLATQYESFCSSPGPSFSCSTIRTVFNKDELTKYSHDLNVQRIRACVHPYGASTVRYLCYRLYIALTRMCEIQLAARAP